MRRLVPLLLVVLIFGGFAAAGCDNDTVKDEARKAIKRATAEQATAKQAGVEVSPADLARIASAEKKLDSDSVQALILATEARANINNDIQDAVNQARATFDTAAGAAQTIISRAPAGADVAQAKQSLATAKAKAEQAGTMDDWYNPASGAIYFANLAAQEASAAAVARAGEQAAEAQIQRIHQSAVQLVALMRNYITARGGNPADYKLGIAKVSADANWAVGHATPITSTPGGSPVNFLFQYANGAWVLKAAPSWTPGQFGAPADMVP